MGTDDHEVESRLEVRLLHSSDYEQVAALQTRCFPTIPPWSRAQFESQLSAFSEGQICVEIDGNVVAASSGLIIAESDYQDHHTFDEITDRSSISNHNPHGDTLYGIDIVVDPEMRGMRLARRLYEERKDLVERLNLKRIMIAGRMPGYQQHANDYSPNAYVRAVVARELHDPVLTAQLANGFVIKSVIRGYLPNDKESLGNAVLMEWHNPAYTPDGDSTGKVRIATVQYQMRSLSSFEDFARQCEFFIDTAGDYRADFVVFPELLTNQLLELVADTDPAKTARRLTEFTDRYVTFFSAKAIKYNVNIIGGSHLTVEDDKLYNIAYLFGRDGSIQKQYKIHITPSERKWWGVTPGDELRVFDTDSGRVAITICYDIEFPELSRIARAKGAQILFVPYNTDIRSSHLRVRSCAQARCIENHVYCVLSGACGNLPLVEGADIHYAQSCILTPSDIPFARDGVAAEATPNVETMLVHELDIDLLRRTERTGTVRTWLDRRSDIYEVTLKKERDTEV